MYRLHIAKYTEFVCNWTYCLAFHRGNWRSIVLVNTAAETLLVESLAFSLTMKMLTKLCVFSHVTVLQGSVLVYVMKEIRQRGYSLTTHSLSKILSEPLIFCGPCIVICLRNKDQQDAPYYTNCRNPFKLDRIFSRHNIKPLFQLSSLYLKTVFVIFMPCFDI